MDRTRAMQATERRNSIRGPRCVASGRVQITDICADVKTLSQMLLLCERRYADALSNGDTDRAGHWANVGDALLGALRQRRPAVD